MGNTSLAPPTESSYAYGSSTQQIDGILVLKQHHSPQSHTKHRWRLRGERNRHSPLVKLILRRDWPNVLVRARLHPTEIHEFCVLEMPLALNPETNGKVTRQRLTLLPLHVACALRPPPEVVRELVSHKVVTGVGKTPHSYRPKPKPSKRSRFVAQENHWSPATVGVERLVSQNIGKSLWDFLRLFMTQNSVIAKRSSIREDDTEEEGVIFSPRAGENESSGDSFAISHGMTAIDEEGESSERSSTAISERSNDREVTAFLQQMEEHLACNGRSPESSLGTTHSSSRRRRSIFVLDFDPSVLLPSPASVRTTEKQQKIDFAHNPVDTGLVSLENSIGDDEAHTAMTTSTPRLVGNIRRESQESSSVYLTDEEVEPSSSASSTSSSSLEEPPPSHASSSSSGSDISGGTGDDSHSFLQLTADGGLAMLDLSESSREASTSPSAKQEASEEGSTNSKDAPEISGSRWESSFLSNDSGIHSATTSHTSKESKDTFTGPKTFVPEDIGLDLENLWQSFPKASKRRRNHELHTRKERNILSSRLLPLHIACLCRASASVLEILLREFPKGSSIEALGMLPVHMVCANWSLAQVDERDDKSIQGTESEAERLRALIEASPRTLWVTSSAHGLRPLEYNRILLCYPSNALDEGMLAIRTYLNSKELAAQTGTTSGSTFEHESSFESIMKDKQHTASN